MSVLPVIYKIKRARRLRKSRVSKDRIQSEIQTRKATHPIFIRSSNAGDYVYLRSSRHMGDAEVRQWHHDGSKSSYQSALRGAERCRDRIYREWVLEDIYSHLRSQECDQVQMLAAANRTEDFHQLNSPSKKNQIRAVEEKTDDQEVRGPSPTSQTTTVSLSRAMDPRDVLRALRDSDLGPYLLVPGTEQPDHIKSLEIKH